FSLGVWYGSRRSEPLRRPVVVVFIAMEWAITLIMSSAALQPLIWLPVGWLVTISMVIIVLGVVYLVRINRDSRRPLDQTPTQCWKGGLFYYNPDDPVLFVG